MTKFIDLTNKKFSKLTVIERAENSKSGIARWKCICECGNETVVTGSNLRNGAVKSCGCLRKKSSNSVHNESNTALYRSWIFMIYRCHNPKHFAYKYYGKRGIKVCDEWHDFLAFKKWVEETKPAGDFTIDRKDNDGNYCPENCKWSNKKEQANNRRNNVVIEYVGQAHTLKQWSEILGFDYKNVHNRIYKLGWTFEEAISKPIDKSKRNKIERKK